MSVHDDFIFKDGQRENMDSSDFMKYNLNEAVSDSTSFTIGSAIIKKYTATLNNMDEKFSTYDFEGLDILAKVGIQLEDGSVEIVPKGKFRCVNASFNENTIELEAYDSMLFFDRPYTDSTLSYPATIRQIVDDACHHCQMTYDAKTLVYPDYVVEYRPNDSSMTFRDVIGYCAQIMCCYAKIDHLDVLSFGWYDFETLEKVRVGYDGGRLSDYRTGDELDGGDFTDYASGDSTDDDTFLELNGYHHLYSLGSQKINTNDIVITGVQVTAENENGSDQDAEELFLYGGEGYILAIEGNPFIQKGKAGQVAAYIGSKIVGKRFRPLSVNCQSNPCMEAGDCACITDRKQRTYFTVICSTTFVFGGLQSVECTAETPTENNYTKYGAQTKLLEKADQGAKRRISSYEIAVRHLTDLMTQCFGVFKSEEVLEDGSVIYYMHNRPERADSSVLWKMTADALAVSTDGGTTWNAGIDADGNAVVNILNVIGLNADWINAGNISADMIQGGTLVVGGENNHNGSILIKDIYGNIIASLNSLGLSTYHINTMFNNGRFSIGDTIGIKNSDEREPGDRVIQITPNYIYLGSLTRFIRVHRDTLEVVKSVPGTEYNWSISQDGEADFRKLSNIVSGTVTITPSAANTPTAKVVSWDLRSTPAVSATPVTTVPGTAVLGIGIKDPTVSGCTFYVTRKNTTGTVIAYTAIVND